MNGTLIVSERGFKVWVSRQLVFEWEDEMLKAIEGSRLFLEKDFEVNGHRLLGSLARRTGVNLYCLQLRGEERIPLLYVSRFESQPMEPARN